MADCYRCGAEIQFATVEGTDERIALDAYESFAGEDRYTVDQEGFAHPVDRFADVAAYTKHAGTCTSGADSGSRG